MAKTVELIGLNRFGGIKIELTKSKSKLLVFWNFTEALSLPNNKIEKSFSNFHKFSNSSLNWNIRKSLTFFEKISFKDILCSFSETHSFSRFFFSRLKNFILSSLLNIPIPFLQLSKLHFGQFDRSLHLIKYKESFFANLSGLSVPLNEIVFFFNYFISNFFYSFSCCLL